MKKLVFYKSKLLKHFKDEDFNRVKLQKTISNKINCLPQIDFVIENNCIVQYIEYIQRVPFKRIGNNLSNLWQNFLSDINLMHSYNYVHGDILMKNIIYDGVRLKLIDHELSLYDKGQLRVTYPWVDVADFKKKTVTKSTDKICLKATELRLFNFNEYKEFRKSQELLITSLMRLHK